MSKWTIKGKFITWKKAAIGGHVEARHLLGVHEGGQYR